MADQPIGQTTYLSVRQVAHILGVTPCTVYRMCRAERLAFILTGAAGTTYRIPQTSLDAHLDQTAAPAPTLVPHLDGQIALVG